MTEPDANGPPDARSEGDELGPFDESNPFDEAEGDLQSLLMEDTDFDLGDALKEVRKSLEEGTRVNYTVLIADDDDNSRRILSRYLSNEGMSVIEDNGRTAVQKAAQYTVDLILLEIVIQGTSGFDIGKQLRANRSTAHIPIIVCSARKDRDSIVRAAGIGAVDYIVKPFNRETVLEKILKVRKKQATHSPPTPILATAPPPAASTARPERADVAPPKLERPILVIDDERMARHILKVILEQSGYEVIEAARGEDGLRALGQHAFDVIFLDIMMPGMNGFQVAQKIRTVPKLAALPIILCTARSAKEDILLAAKLGIRHLIRKPFDRQTVLRKLAEAVGQGGAESPA